MEPKTSIIIGFILMAVGYMVFLFICIVVNKKAKLKNNFKIDKHLKPDLSGTTISKSREVIETKKKSGILCKYKIELMIPVTLGEPYEFIWTVPENTRPFDIVGIRKFYVWLFTKQTEYFSMPTVFLKITENNKSAQGSVQIIKRSTITGASIICGNFKGDLE